jgi:integrase
MDIVGSSRQTLSHAIFGWRFRAFFPACPGSTPRAVNALRQRARRNRKQAVTGPAYNDQGLVFCRPDGRPLRPARVLHRFRELTDAAGLPRVRVHDLRHFAATIMIASGVPLAMVSKTLRHSTLSTTVDIYGHLTRQAAHEAAVYGDHLSRRARSGPPSTWTIPGRSE